MAGDVVDLVFRIRGDGFDILDRAGNKLGEVAGKAKEAETATTSLGTTGATALSRLGAAASEASAGTLLLAGGAAVAAAAVAAAAYAVGKSVEANVARADSLNKLSIATGQSVRDLSVLELAARRNGVELTSLGGGLTSLNRITGDAANGIGRQAALLGALGIQTRETSGALRGGLPLLENTAEAFNRLPDGTTKSAAAVRLFGGDAAVMLQIMKGGAPAIRALAKDADDLGFTLDGKVKESADAVTNNLNRAKAAAYGFGLSIGQPFLDVAAAATGKLADFAEAADKAAKVDPKDFWQRTKEGAVAALPFLGEAVAAYQTIGEVIDKVRSLSLRSLLVPGSDLPFGGIHGPNGDQLFAGPNAAPLVPSQLDDYSSIFPGDAIAGLGGLAQNGLPTSYRQALVASALGRPPRTRTGGGGGTGDAANRLATLTDQSILGEQQANVTNAQTALALSQQELDVFRQRVDLAGVFASTESERLALLNQSQDEELALARQIDDLHVALLDKQIAELEARKQDHDVVEATSKGLTGQLEKLDAQEASLRAQEDILRSTGGEAAKVADQYARARAEIEASHRLVVNLGDTTNQGLQRALDGVFNSGSKFDVGAIVGDTSKAIGSSLIGGFLEAEAKKAEFDAKVSDNFTVTLPGFMKSGVDQIGDIWGELMGFMGASSEETGQSILSSFTAAFGQSTGVAQSGANSITGLLRNIPGIGGWFSGAADSTSQIAGAAASQPVLDS
ncbi:MAG: hypothetical protein ABI629_25760, partial [bacterium]